MVGLRVSLVVALSAQLIVVAIGVTLGMLAGFLGGWVDMAVQRLVEAIAAIPWMLLTLVLISALGSGLLPTILAIALTSWVDVCRLVRARILTLREKEYIEAAHAIGIPEHQVALRHFLPGTVTPIITAVTLGIPAVIFAEAGLSFLGLGINDPLPSLGKMVGYSAPYLRSYWHLGLFPTLTIALAMLGFSLLGDGLRDALDPRAPS
jgi:ABC-type dipeptide/oligopeptide/nickel transport system permease subunit